MSIQYWFEGRKMEKKVRNTACGIEEGARKIKDIQKNLFEIYC